MDATQLVQEAQDRHATSPTASAAIGRALIGALLMGCFRCSLFRPSPPLLPPPRARPSRNPSLRSPRRKDDEVVQLTFSGKGPLGTLTAIADTSGNARCYAANPAADPPLRPDGKLDVGTAVGPGILSVVRTHPLMKEPYTGVVPLTSGEIAEDLAAYLANSEQTQSALGAGVSLNRDARVQAAGGFLVSVLPSAEEETIEVLERNLTSMPSVSELITAGKSPREIAEVIAGPLGLRELGEMVPRYGPCDEEELRGRMKRAVATLGETEVRSIIEEQGFLEVTCEFCKTSLKMGEGDVAEIMTWASEFNASK